MKKEQLKQLEELKKQEAEARIKRQEMEQEEVDRVQKPRLKKLVGQCYAYRNNSYSCPSKKSDYWDVYRKILDWVDTKERGFHFIIEEFAIDSEGKVNFSVDDNYPYLNKEWWNSEPFSGYVKISSKEYEAEKKKMLEEMKSQKKLRKILETKYN